MNHAARIPFVSQVTVGDGLYDCSCKQIISNEVDLLNLSETQEAMKKLEMYNLANASHWMKQTDGFPYIESICNQRDTVSG